MRHYLDNVFIPYCFTRGIANTKYPFWAISALFYQRNEFLPATAIANIVVIRYNAKTRRGGGFGGIKRI